MSERTDSGTGPGGNDASTVEVFQESWQIYRKVVDNNYLFHTEAYGRLHQFLIEEITNPFRFLDIACGDASASVSALRGAKIASYRGIDFSAAALEIAARTLTALPCPIQLDERDFRGIEDDPPNSCDVAWIGLSLHHLQLPEKAPYMAGVRRLLSPGGQLLVYENAGPDGESRAQWMERWDAQRPSWEVFSEFEWNSITSHVHSADYPECASDWPRLAQDAGYRVCRELYRSPTDLFRLYCFSA